MTSVTKKPMPATTIRLRIQKSASPKRLPTRSTNWSSAHAPATYARAQRHSLRLFISSNESKGGILRTNRIDERAQLRRQRCPPREVEEQPICMARRVGQQPAQPARAEVVTDARLRQVGDAHAGQREIARRPGV